MNNIYTLAGGQVVVSSNLATPTTQNGETRVSPFSCLLLGRIHQKDACATLRRNYYCCSRGRVQYPILTIQYTLKAVCKGNNRCWITRTDRERTCGFVPNCRCPCIVVSGACQKTLANVCHRKILHRQDLHLWVFCRNVFDKNAQQTIPIAIIS